MAKTIKSRNAVDGSIHLLRKGLAVYKVYASPFYRVRIWVPSQRKYLVKSTKTSSKISATEAAEEYYTELRENQFIDTVPKSRLFATYADKLIDQQRKMAADGKIHPKQATNDESILLGEGGVCRFFGRHDVGTIRHKQLKEYLDDLRTNRSSQLAPSTINKKIIALRKVLKLAYEDGVIDAIPDTPLIPRQDNPRPFFKFAPLVSKDRDEYSKLIDGAKELASKNVTVRGIPITEELYDFILFMTHSFLRPVESEIFALRHRHINVAENPKRLILTIADGKTGFRTTNTLEACVSVYQRICRRHEDHADNDFIFLPTYANRRTAIRVINRQFNHLLAVLNLKIDPITKQTHTVYSLRHTAICMRLIKSEGRVNIFNLAKTAGTSVEQIERFYARHLPLSAEMARNLQSFGSD